MKRTTKKVLAILLTVAMLLSVTPGAFAAMQLATPTGLAWGDGTNGKYGAMMWQAVSGCEGTYKAEVYLDGNRIREVHLHDFYGEPGALKTDMYPVIHALQETGDYYFTMQAIGDDGITYTDSEVATSPVLHYVKPRAQIGMTTSLYWGENRMPCWVPVDNAYMYKITYYGLTETNEEVHSYLSCNVRADRVKQLGNGYVTYYDDFFLEKMPEYEKENNIKSWAFTVQAISDDISEVYNGEESVLSTGINITEIASTVLEKLDKIRTEDAADIADQVAAVNDSVGLQMAMTTDAGVRERVATLETAYAAEKKIAVSIDVKENAGLSGSVQILGAALNSTGSAVTFEISKAEETAYIPELYKNVTLVNMDLQGVELNEDNTLKVPVYITIPVPDSVTKPENFRILHYHQADDGYDFILPILSADKKTASFVLSHFSVFALAEAVEDEGSEDKPSSGDNTGDKPSPSRSNSSGGFTGTYNYPVKADSTGDATVTFDKNNAVAGDKVTITVKPNTGKVVDEVIVTDADNNVLTVTKVGDNKYSFTMPSGAVKVAVTTKAATYENRIVLQVGNRNVLVDQNTWSNDVAPVIVDNRTMVPIRVITKALGGKADWNEATQTVTLTIEGNVLCMTIGQTIPGFDAAPVILNSRTYVPIRYVAEKLGATVEWIAETQQIIIEK